MKLGCAECISHECTQCWFEHKLEHIGNKSVWVWSTRCARYT